MAEYYALSLYPQHMHDIADGLKVEEYRTRKTNIRGDIILCCTATKETNGFACLMVDLYDCEHRGDHYAYLLRNIRAIAATPVKGQQGFFKLQIEPEVFDIRDQKSIDYAFNKVAPQIFKKKKYLDEYFKGFEEYEKRRKGNTKRINSVS